MTSELHYMGLVRDFLATATRPLIVVLGPTASGKTAFSLDLATSLQGSGRCVEIINADSRQFYRGLDIGTAKIRPEEMRGIPHHLIDVLEPSEEVTIAWFKEKASAVIDDMHRRGHVPMLVGGSMLYLSAIIDGLEPLPAADPEHRRRLEEEYDRDGGVTLLARLAEADPDAAASIARQNKVYVVRALELLDTTGMPSRVKHRSDCPYDLLIFGMDVPREELAKKIDARTAAMLDAGWIDEVRALRAAGLDSSAPAMKSHGYREILAALDAGTVDKRELATVIASKTRQYAKRQMTWWRGDDRIRWIVP